MLPPKLLLPLLSTSLMLWLVLSLVDCVNAMQRHGPQMLVNFVPGHVRLFLHLLSEIFVIVIDLHKRELPNQVVEDADVLD